MKKSLIFTVVIVSACLQAASVSAQNVEEARLNQPSATNSYGVQPALSPFGLIDFSKIKWSHSYSVSFFSGGGTSSSVGLATTSMFYEFSSRLSLQVDLGIAHNPGAIWGDGSDNAFVLPAFHLDWRPSDNTHLSVSFQRYSGGLGPAGYGGYYGWGPRYWR